MGRSEKKSGMKREKEGGEKQNAGTREKVKVL